jgi:hypothetical protein
MSVATAQRFTKDRRCPICQGCDRDPRGTEKRCHGYRSSDGLYAHCARVECGDIEEGDTYAHRLNGPCACGQQHGEPIENLRGNVEYIYRDAAGNPYMRVTRTPGKDFYQARWENARWENGLKGIKPILYRLDEIERSPRDSIVYVTEGEKDADNMRAAGFLATTSPMGAEKWSKAEECAHEHLRGRHLLLLPHDDDKGRKHVSQVAASMLNVAASVRQLVLYPEAETKRDVSDWFAEGHTADELKQLTADLSPILPSEHPAKWKRCRDLVDEILARAKEPWVDVQLNGEKIVSVRPGGLVLLIGGTGRGKTSLTASLLIDHAQRQGPAIAMSLELTGDEWTARSIGTQCDASWGSVLRGEVSAGQMLKALPERLAIVERDDGSIEALEQAIDDLRREYPDEPILIAVDYVQLVGADDEEEIRPRIGKVMRKLDRLARSKRVVLIALSQGSRASARALSSGEVIGAATTDSGAESADLERWASVTLAIGQHGKEQSDGSCHADLSIGKSRMGGGDRVLPACYFGKSGLWRLNGEAQLASDVRDERAASKKERDVDAAKERLRAAAEKSTAPKTREEWLRVARCGNVPGKAALDDMLDAHELVRVQRKKPHSPQWQIWTPSKAEGAGIPLVGDDS